MTAIETIVRQLLLTFMWPLSSFDQDMRVEKTLASQLSTTLMQLFFSFDLDIRFEETLMNTNYRLPTLFLI